MMSGLVAALGFGFNGGPSADPTAVMEMRQSNRGLIVGTWEQCSDGYALTWEFRRDGNFTFTCRSPDGDSDIASGTYRLEAERLNLAFAQLGRYALKVEHLGPRVLVLTWHEILGTVRYRRR
jgi:hypothetical protein